MKRKGTVAIGYLILALLVIGILYALFLLFAPASSNQQSYVQQKPPSVDIKGPNGRVPSIKALQTPTTSNPWGIAFDSSHHILWVAEPGCEPRPICFTQASGILGEYDQLHGSWIQDFPEPLGYTRPAFVAIDASGNVWFTDFDANSIGFFNAHTDTCVENPIPTPVSDPYGITRDLRGNIWFTENRVSVGHIGSFTPTASGRVAIVEHRVTTAQPHLITADKQGNIWYSDSELGLVGYLIPSTGHLVTRTISTQPGGGSTQDESAYDGLAVDGYNDVWFTELYSSLIVMWPKKTVK